MEHKENSDPNPSNFVQTDLNVVDLQNIKTLIEMASQKGIIPPTAFIPFGEVYTKINNILKESNKI